MDFGDAVAPATCFQLCLFYSVRLHESVETNLQTVRSEFSKLNAEREKTRFLHVAEGSAWQRHGSNDIIHSRMPGRSAWIMTLVGRSFPVVD